MSYRDPQAKKSFLLLSPARGPSRKPHFRFRASGQDNTTSDFHKEKATKIPATPESRPAASGLLLPPIDRLALLLERFQALDIIRAVVDDAPEALHPLPALRAHRMRAGQDA